MRRAHKVNINIHLVGGNGRQGAVGGGRGTLTDNGQGKGKCQANWKCDEKREMLSGDSSHPPTLWTNIGKLVYLVTKFIFEFHV